MSLSLWVGVGADEKHTFFAFAALTRNQIASPFQQVVEGALPSRRARMGSWYSLGIPGIPSKPSLMQAWWPFWDKCGTHSLWVGGAGSAQTKGWRITALLWNLLPGTSLLSLDCGGPLLWVVKHCACCII